MKTDIFISYALNFEDVMLWRGFKNVNKGFYIDIGAGDPEQGSVTKSFYERGWRGINLEPSLSLFEKIEASRTRDINIQATVGPKSGGVLLYEFPQTTYSTFDSTVAKRIEKERGYKSISRKVEVKSLSKICETYHCSPIHFLRLNLQAVTDNSLGGVDLSKIRPWVILIQAIDSLHAGKVSDRLDNTLSAQDYDFVYFDGVNRYYVAEEQNKLKKYFGLPPNSSDEFYLSGTQAFCLGQVPSTKSVEQGNEMSVRVRTLQIEMSVMRQNLESVLVQMTEARLQNKHLVLMYDELKIKLLQERAVLDEKNNSLKHLEDELEKTKAHLVETLGTNHNWWVLSCEYKEEIERMKRSYSWRITFPLRIINNIPEKMIYLPFYLKKRITIFLENIIRSVSCVLVKVIRLVSQNSPLALRVKSWLHQSPLLKHKVKSLLNDPVSTPRRAEFQQVHPVHRIEAFSKIDTSEMPAGAKRLLRILKTT